MGTKPKKPKKVGFWYKTGKGFGYFFSSIRGESGSEERRVEDSAKDHILQFMFVKDLKDLMEDFNLPDPEETKDPETGEIIRTRKNLEEFREYVKKKIDLYDLENYLIRYPHLLQVTGQSEIRSSTVAVYAALVAAIRQEIHWTQYNIIDILIKEDINSYETVPYVTFWLKEIDSNYSRFAVAVDDFTDRENSFLNLGFDRSILENIKTMANSCRDLYRSFRQHIEGALRRVGYTPSSLQSYRTQFSGLDRLLYDELRNIRRYSYNIDIGRETRDRHGMLVKIRGTINNLFLLRFKFKLLNDDEMSLDQISKDCPDINSFTTNLAALGNVIDKINVPEIKKKLKKLPQDGSINFLEEFLIENFPDFDITIVKNLRDIMTIRSQWPIHGNTSKGVTLIEEIYGTYPPDDYGVFWFKVLDRYTISLAGLQGLLSR